MTIDHTKNSTQGDVVKLVSIITATGKGAIITYKQGDKFYRVYGDLESEAGLDLGYYNNISITYDIDPKDIEEVK